MNLVQTSPLLSRGLSISANPSVVENRRNYSRLAAWCAPRCAAGEHPKTATERLNSAKPRMASDAAGRLPPIATLDNIRRQKRPPPASRCEAAQAVAFEPIPEAGHVGLDPGLIDGDQAIEAGLPGPPASPPAGDIGEPAQARTAFFEAQSLAHQEQTPRSARPSRRAPQARPRDHAAADAALLDAFPDNSRCGSSTGPAVSAPFARRH